MLRRNFFKAASGSVIAAAATSGASRGGTRHALKLVAELCEVEKLRAPKIGDWPTYLETVTECKDCGGLLKASENFKVEPRGHRRDCDVLRFLEAQ